MAYEQERVALKAALNSKKWSTKVDNMTDDQVIAVYLRLKQQKKI